MRKDNRSVCLLPSFLFGHSELLTQGEHGAGKRMWFNQFTPRSAQPESWSLTLPLCKWITDSLSQEPFVCHYINCLNPLQSNSEPCLFVFPQPEPENRVRARCRGDRQDLQAGNVKQKGLAEGKPDLNFFFSLTCEIWRIESRNMPGHLVPWLSRTNRTL